MIGAIPNPKKSFDIDFNSKEVFEKTQYLPLITKFKFHSKNEVLKTYRFESLEFLSFGVWVDISISSITEEKSKVEIEILRKIGAFDKSYEVSEAGRHIVELSEGITKCIVLTPEQIETIQKGIIEAQNKEANRKWHEWGISVAWLLFLFPPLGIILMWKNGNFHWFFRIILTFVSLMALLIEFALLNEKFGWNIVLGPK
jgi:hypothetical protein